MTGWEPTRVIKISHRDNRRFRQRHHGGGDMRSNGDDRPSDLVRSVSRAFRILEEVGAAGGPVTVKAVARRTELNLSTTYHLVRTLAYEGYLQRLADGRYVLGGAVAHRFRDLLGSFGQPPEVHGVLAHLSATTKCTAYLGRFVAGTIRVTDMVEGPASPYLEDIEVGLDVAAHATAIGKALLATLSVHDRAVYLADQGMRPFTRRTTTTVEKLEEELAGVAPGRPVMECGQFRVGVSCAGALVRRDSASDPWWAVVVSTRHERMPAVVAEQALLAAADLSSPSLLDPPGQPDLPGQPGPSSPTGRPTPRTAGATAAQSSGTPAAR